MLPDISDLPGHMAIFQKSGTIIPRLLSEHPAPGRCRRLKRRRWLPEYPLAVEPRFQQRGGLPRAHPG